MGCFPLISLSWSLKGGQEAASKKWEHGFGTERPGCWPSLHKLGAAWSGIAHKNVAMKSKRAIKAIGDAAKDSNNLCNSLVIKALVHEAEVEETKPFSSLGGLNTVRLRMQLHHSLVFFLITGLRTRLG